MEHGCLVHLAVLRGEHQPAQPWHKRKEAEHDQPATGKDTEGNHFLGDLTISVSGDLCQVPSSCKDDAKEKCQHQVGSPVEEPGQRTFVCHISAKCTHPSGELVPPLEEHEVAPAEVQQLQPEAEPDVVRHAEADGVQAARGREGRALGEAPVGGRAHVARRLASGMQGGEGDLTDAAVGTRTFVVADSSGVEEQWTTRIQTSTLQAQVTTIRKEVHL
mmetsp:Transcript_93528/g.273877  ORF Transcript_93528/g.273877 Transcript_93528/m.273877 type:complete len:218 (-) Transcript_93528:1578-2231(-)